MRRASTMGSVILDQLDTFGPTRCPQLTSEQAADYTRSLAITHYENFSVVTRLLPARLHADFANVYAFCRWADDLGDETGDPARSLELLAWWRKELADCYAGKPRHPVFVALRPTMQRHAIPAKPFEDLIDAFEQDQRLNRYQTWDQVLDYCSRSADPVGRLVLYMCGHSDPHRQSLSDSTCTALQLINFWQDVRRDILERDRIYVPAEALAEVGLSHQLIVAHVRGVRPLTSVQHDACRVALGNLVKRTMPMFARGRQLWPQIPREMQVPIRLFTLGGEAVARRIAAIGYDTLERRPTLGKVAKLGLMARAVIGKAFDRSPRGHG